MDLLIDNELSIDQNSICKSERGEVDPSEITNYTVSPRI